MGLPFELEKGKHGTVVGAQDFRASAQGQRPLASESPYLADIGLVVISGFTRKDQGYSEEFQKVSPEESSWKGL